MGILNDISYKMKLMRPITKKEWLQSRYEVAEMIKVVKEIEATNRTDIAYLLNKLAEQANVKMPEHKEEDYQYQ